MLNCIWIFLIVFSFVISLINGNAAEFSSSVLDSASVTVNLVLKLAGIICLWSGVMNIAEKAGVCRLISKLLKPILRVLFPKNKNDDAAMDSVALNVTANIFGLGNAATPAGLEAVKRMRENSIDKNTASADIMTFVVMNTAALRLIPSTAASLRAAAGAKEPMDIIFCVWISSSLALISAIVAVKISGRFRKK